MKRSRILLLFALICAILPPAIIKISMFLAFTSQSWTFHSSRVRLNTRDVQSIELKDVKTFRYQYDSDSTYLEYNKKCDDQYLQEVKSGRLTISAKPKVGNSRVDNGINAAQLNAQHVIFKSLPVTVFAQLKPSELFLSSANLKNIGSLDLIYHGPTCPPIKAFNTTFYIDSVGANTSFDFDLDFSTFYWENFATDPDGHFNKKLTIPWYLDSMNLKLNGSIYYLTDNIHFNKINIKAIKKTNLDIDGDFYQVANIEVDPSVIVRAPVSIWNKLKLTVKD